MSVSTPENGSVHNSNVVHQQFDPGRFGQGFRGLTENPETMLQLLAGFARYADHSDHLLAQDFEDELFGSEPLDTEPRTTSQPENPSLDHMRNYLLMRSMQNNPEQGYDKAATRVESMPPQAVEKFYRILFASQTEVENQQ